MVYAPGTTWPENTYYVTLPTYMEARNIELQVRPSDDESWVSVPLSRITVQATGTHAIQVPWKNDSLWQLIFYVENGQLPVTAPTLDADITTTSTTLSVSPAVDVAPAGWILIDSEYISYAGVESSASSTVLSSLGRAANFSTLGTHAAARFGLLLCGGARPGCVLATDGRCLGSAVRTGTCRLVYHGAEFPRTHGKFLLWAL